jgi:hypothetical protein
MDVNALLQEKREAILQLAAKYGAHIERYTVQGGEAFERDELIQSCMVRHLQIAHAWERILRRLPAPLQHPHFFVPSDSGRARRQQGE